MDVKSMLDACYQSVEGKIPFRPLVAIILGSGLGEYAQRLPIEGEISYNDIPGFPVSSVAGHRGRFVFSHICGVPVVLMQGRVHYYEGYSMQQVVLPLRLMRTMGAQIVFLTNAAGSLNPLFQPGELMLIQDHISTFVPSPLTGENQPEWGERFPDMSCVYDKELIGILQHAGEETGMPLREGVYIQLTGPQYETPAEVRMCRLLGADAVGMSTVCEAIAARHMGMRVCGVSCLTNFGCGMTAQPLNHEEVQKMGRQVAGRFERLVETAVKGMRTCLAGERQ